MHFLWPCNFTSRKRSQVDTKGKGKIFSYVEEDGKGKEARQEVENRKKGRGGWGAPEQ